MTKDIIAKQKWQNKIFIWEWSILWLTSLKNAQQMAKKLSGMRLRSLKTREGSFGSNLVIILSEKESLRMLETA